MQHKQQLCRRWKAWYMLGSWKRQIWSDADTDMDTDTDNFKIHCTLTQHLFFIPNIVVSLPNPGLGLLSIYKRRGERWTISLRVLQTIILS